MGDYSHATMVGGSPIYALTNSPPMEGCPEGGGGCFGGMRGLATVETVNHPVRLRLPPLLWRGICRVRLSFNVFLYADFWQNHNLVSAYAARPPTFGMLGTFAN